MQVSSEGVSQTRKWETDLQDREAGTTPRDGGGARPLREGVRG